MPSQAKQDEAGRASFWTIWTLRNSVARRIKDKTCFEDLGLPLATIVVRVRGPVPSSKGLTFIDREFNYLNTILGCPKRRDNWPLWSRLQTKMSLPLASDAINGHCIGHLVSDRTRRFFAPSLFVTFVQKRERETVRLREYPNETLRGRCGMLFCLRIKTSYLG